MVLGNMYAEALRLGAGHLDGLNVVAAVVVEEVAVADASTD